MKSALRDSRVVCSSGKDFLHTPPAEVPVLLLRACKSTWYIRSCILVIDSYAYSRSAQVVKTVLDVREAEQDVRVKSRILIVAATPSSVNKVGKMPMHAGCQQVCCCNQSRS
jgi:hypothetical protein